MKKRKILTILGIVLCCSIAISTFKVDLGNFSINFKHFIIADNNPVEKPIELTPLNLDKSIIDNSLNDKLNSLFNELFNKIANKEFYYSNFNNKDNFYAPIKSLFTPEYYSKISSDGNENNLKKAIDNIYFQEHSAYKEIHILNIGYNLDGLYSIVEIISTNDSNLFNTQQLKFYFDKDFKVTNIDKVSDNIATANTTKPIDKNSLLEKNNAEFQKSLDNLFSKLKNAELYKTFKEKDDSDVEFQINTLVENIKIKNKSNEALKDMFLCGKGTLNNYVISGYEVSDINASAISTYIIDFADGQNKKQFKIEYSRVLKEIVKVVNM